jgi:putative salt-induced outer membrane protein YdiY
MRSNIKRSLVVAWLVVWNFAAQAALADRVVTKSGETFQGTIVEENDDAVVFDSLAAGRITISRSNIDVLEKTPPPAPAAETPTPASTANEKKPKELTPTFSINEGKYLTEAGKPLAELNPLKGWTSSLNLGYTALRGEESNERLEIRFRSEKKTTEKEYLIDSGYDFASTVLENNVTAVTDQRVNVQFQFRHYLGRQEFFFQSNTRYYRNVIEELLHEGTQTVGIGYRWRGQSWTASATPAIGPRVRDVAGEWESLWVGGILQDFEWRITPTLSLRESLEYLVSPDKFTDSSRRAWIELTQRLSAVWTLNFRYEYTYDSAVGADSPNEQQRWSVTLGLQF